MASCRATPLHRSPEQHCSSDQSADQTRLVVGSSSRTVFPGTDRAKGARLTFCKVTQDGDWEGCLHLDRLPTADEAVVIREVLGIRKRRHMTGETLSKLGSPFRREDISPAHCAEAFGRVASVPIAPASGSRSRASLSAAADTGPAAFRARTGHAASVDWSRPAIRAAIKASISLSTQAFALATPLTGFGNLPARVSLARCERLYLMPFFRSLPFFRSSSSPIRRCSEVLLISRLLTR